MKKDTAIEIKVGALVLFAGSLLVAFVLILGDFTFSEGFEFHVQFDNAGGLKPGADVAIAGINVGSVHTLQFIQNDDAGPGSDLTAVAVQATVRLNPRYADAVRENSQFFITTRGVLGEPYIEVVTQTFDKPQVKSGMVLRGVDPPRMDILLSKLSSLLNTVTDLLDDPNVHVIELIANTSSFMKNMDGLVTDNRDNIDSTFEGVRATSEEAARLLATLNTTVGEGEQLRAILNDAQATSSNARRISARVNTSVNPVMGDVDASTQSLRRVSESAERILVGREDQIGGAVENLHATSENLVAMSSDAQELINRLNDGEGSIGAILSDREIYEDMKEILRIIKQQPWKILWKE